jgi:hypothetical protein
MQVFIQGATLWLCHYCNREFWWHPGASNRATPSECACGQIKDPNLLMRVPDEPVQGNGKHE